MFRKKTTPKKQEPVVEEVKASLPQVPVVDEDEIAAVIIAAILAGGQASASNLAVRSIVRVPEQGTAWNRLNLERNVELK